MYYQVDLETMPREDIEALQLRRLRATVERCYNNVPFYKKRFDEKGVRPSDIRSLDDLKRLPFTHKQDLRDQYPTGFLAVPREQINRFHASSGTTGKAVIVGHTARDLDNWATLVARGLCASGLKPGDHVHVAYGYGLFTGGLGLHDGAQKLGCQVVPASGGNTHRQVAMLRDLQADCLACTPSFALYIAETGREMGVDFRRLPLRVGVFGGEPWSKSMREVMQDTMGIDPHNIYGLSEIMGPGCAIDCMEHSGLHLWEDHFIAEIIDPATGENLPDGEVGELVLTTITREGQPMIRYRTRDLTSITREVCSCGRTHARLGRFRGRSDDMLIIRGVNFFPQQVEDLILKSEGLSPNYLIVVDRKGNLDTVEIQVEMNEALVADKIGDVQGVCTRLQKSVKEFLGVTTKITLKEPHAIERSAGKATRVIDNRQADVSQKKS